MDDTPNEEPHMGDRDIRSTTEGWIDRFRDEAGISTPNSLIGILVVIILIIIIIQLL